MVHLRFILNWFHELGKRQHYELGKWLRKRYDNFLSRGYDPAEISVRSSDKDRCLMSAACNLAALYPPTPNQTWNPQLPWQPIPIHAKPGHLDDRLQMSKKCDRYDAMLERVRKNDFFARKDRENVITYRYLSNRTGLDIKTFSDAYDLYATLRIEDLNRMKLPDWTASVYPTKLYELYRLTWMTYTYTPKLSRFAVGVFLEDVRKQFRKYVSGVHNRKFIMNSAHGSTIVDVMRALNMEIIEVPYAGAILFELRERAGVSYVKAYFKSGDEVRELKIGGCSCNAKFECAYESFMGVLGKLSWSSEKREKECKLKS